MAEALVIIATMALLGVVAYFDLVSSKVSDGNRGFATVVTAIFCYFVVKLVFRATRNFED